MRFSLLPPRIAVALLLALPVAAVVVWLTGPTPTAAQARPARLELRKGDHVCIIGNTLAERLQHDGWLDTSLHARFPHHDLVIRNLGFSADELTVRLRSAHFGTPDQWLSGEAPQPRPVAGADANRFELTGTKADVILAFFGYNESFAGKDGLPKFKKDLDAFVKHTLAQKYNGKSAPRLVLFSPIAHEDLKNPNLPDGKANNQRIRLYTAAMSEVATANGVVFVDLFAPTLAGYARAGSPWTINGIHLNEDGNRQLADIIDQALFGPRVGPDEKASRKLRAAVLQRNFYWFHRYRTTDGYSTYGERAFLRFKPDNQSNYVVMQRELRVLDVMTANRDKLVWAAARGQDVKLDDSNTPPFIPVKTNFPGKGPNDTHEFLGGEQAIARMKLAKGLKVNLFADEKMFPELVNPVQMSFDPQGRLWVAVWPTYPHWRPKEDMNDKILILEDTDGDGKADKCTVFADKLHCPTGFELWGGGVLVAQQPDVMFLKDTDGDGKADVRRRVIHGMDSADTHHAANSFVLDPGGAMYWQEGTFHHTQVESPWGPPRRCANAGVFRYEPRAQKFDVYVSFGFANPHGHVFDRWGRDIVIDGTSSAPYDAALFSGHLEFPIKHGRPPQVWDTKSIRPCPGMEVLSSKHFPAEWQGTVLVANVIGFRGIRHVRLRDDGASFQGSDLEPLLSSNADGNFRPSDLRVGPDGALYFLDWCNPIIGHMQHNLRDPSRDRAHGRVYRVTHAGRPLSKSPRIAGEPIEKLLDVLKEPEDRVRHRARIELTGRPTDRVIAAARKWVANLDPRAADHEHHLLEGLWLHQSHNVVDVPLLNRVLKAKEPRARAAATRVLGYWRDRVPGALGLLRQLAADEHPRVRLEAVRAASFFTEPEAVEVPLIAETKPSDRYLGFVRAETMKALRPHVSKAIAEGRKIQFVTPAGARYFLRTVRTDDLLKMERSQGVYLELLFRPGVREEFRKEALGGLAKLERKGELAVLLGAIRDHDANDAADEEGVTFDLIRLLANRPPADLGKARDDLVRMATTSRHAVTRQLGFVALVTADGNADHAWKLALQSADALNDLVQAVSLFSDPGQRSAQYARVSALLGGLPKGMKADTGSAVRGRYVRVELPGKQRTLTLAEVEVFSDGANVARRGKASQINTAHGGVAARAIDGNKSGSYSDGGMSHTRENINNPWWEVDLGAEVPIQSVAVYNRADGLSGRLKNFRLRVLDAQRKEVFSKERNPAPETVAQFKMGTRSPARTVRHAAMRALPVMRGHEADAVKALAKYLKDDADRHFAVRALQRIPPRQWPTDMARPVLDDLLGYVRKVPVAERTAPAAEDALQLADTLAGLLPIEAARKVRKELGELGVRVIRVGTLVERMLYDRERIVVQAGRPVEIAFENTDTMPHNLVFVQPGALEEIGKLGEQQATQPGALERHYVPRSPKVILGSRLLQPRQTQRFTFEVPARPGVYPYVCTYPGHWQRMHGALYVVANLEEYQANPEAYLAKHPLKIADPLLKDNRPRKEWTLAELAPAAKTLAGRSFANGRQMFQVGTCAACHKFGGVGQEFGPDLTKLDPKWTPTDVLEHILEPAKKVDDKYVRWQFQLFSGMVQEGMILKENGASVEIIENPLAAARPMVLKKADIEARTRAKTSMMPKGLLDKMTREEILDLLGYVVSGANPRHKVFQGAHDHGGGHGGHGH